MEHITYDSWMWSPTRLSTWSTPSLYVHAASTSQFQRMFECFADDTQICVSVGANALEYVLRMEVLLYRI